MNLAALASHKSEAVRNRQVELGDGSSRKLCRARRLANSYGYTCVLC